jgi:hypothetical protein
MQLASVLSPVLSSVSFSSASMRLSKLFNYGLFIRHIRHVQGLKYLSVRPAMYTVLSTPLFKSSRPHSQLFCGVFNFENGIHTYQLLPISE